MTCPGSALRLVAILPALLAVLAAPAAGQPPRLEKGSLRLVADRTAYPPGGEASVAAVLAIDDGWHVNSHTPSYDYLIPTEATFSAPAGWAAAGVEYPQGVMRTFAFAETPLSVYEGQPVIIGRLRVPDDAPEGSARVEVAVRYQACDDKSCLPPVTARAQIELALGPDGVAVETDLFAAAAGSGADAAGGGRAAGATAPLAASLPLMLLLGVVGGLILNAMPCVLPVLSLKVFGLVKSAGQGRSAVVGGALATAAGIVLSFWALAGAAVAARAAGAAVGWGVQFQEPLFVAALAVVVVLFCLNLWGLFEIQLPPTLMRVGAGAGPRQGMPGHFVSGLFATLMATPCSAPFLGTAVSFALSQPASTTFAMFSAVGIGMALPYLALAAFPGAARLLPRPGRWMDTLKVVMGFLLAAAAVWLLYVLSSQVSPERLAFFELALLALALFVWLARRSARSWGRRLAAAGVLAATVCALAIAAGAEAVDPLVSTPAASLIEWRPFDRVAAERLAAGGTLVFVDVTADWCFTCKVNERLALETATVAAAFGRHGVIAMKADWTNRDDAIAEYLASFGRYGIPFYVLYRPEAEPHVFGELLTSGELVEVVDISAASRIARAARAD